ncbi:MAG: hypothetical protein ABJB47_05470 [Actinomycetota bacterium]
MRRIFPARSHPVTPSRPLRGRLPRRRLRRAAGWGAAAVAVIAAGSLLVPSSGLVTTTAWTAPLTGLATTDNHVVLAKLEARAARLNQKYRGQVLQLTDALASAKAADARVVQLRRQLGGARQQMATLAAASYMGGGQDPALALLFSDNPQALLDSSATVQYLTQQRNATEQALQRLVTSASLAGLTAEARVAGLRQLITTLEGRRHQVAQLLAKFQPESPTIGGDRITDRMRQVRDAVDRRFGPFAVIGCYRAESSGEHPLGRACDFMLSTGGVLPTSANVQRGYDIAKWAQANASALGIMYIIYRQHIWDIRNPSAGWAPMEDRGSITANHFDHVHISVF